MPSFPSDNNAKKPIGKIGAARKRKGAQKTLLAKLDAMPQEVFDKLVGNIARTVAARRVPTTPASYRSLSVKAGNNVFFGRSGELQLLADALLETAIAPGRAHAPIVVEGQGGIGKSRLVISVLESLWKDERLPKLFPNGFCYHEFRPAIVEPGKRAFDPARREAVREARSRDFVEDLFDACFDPVRRDEVLFEGKPNRAFWGAVNVPGRLVFLDSAESVEDLGALLANFSNTTVIVCLRPPETEAARKFAPTVQLRGLSEGESLELIKSRAGIQGASLDENLKKLLVPLQGSPFAIATYAGLLRDIDTGEAMGVRLERLKEQVRAYDSRGLKFGDETKDFPVMFDIQSEVYPVKALALLPVIALFPMQPVPKIWIATVCFGEDGKPLITGLSNEDAVAEALGRLVNLGVLDRTDDENGEAWYTVTHSLYYVWLRQRIFQFEEIPAFAALVARFLFVLAPILNKAIVDTKDGIDPRRMLPFVERAVEIARGVKSPLLGHILYLYGLYLASVRRFDEALKAYTEALLRMEEAGQKYLLGTTWHQIGWLHLEKRAYGEAVKASEEALRLHEENGQKHLLGATWHQIGRSHEEQGEFGEALKAYHEALRLNEETGQKQRLGGIWHQIGILYQRKRDFDEALKACKEALRLNEETGQKHLLGGTWHQIGMAYQGKHDAAEALKAYNEALRWNRETGQIHQLGNTWHQIGTLHQEKREFDEALKAYNEALRLYQEAGQKFRYGPTFALLMLLYADKHADPKKAADDDGQKAAAFALLSFQHVNAFMPGMRGEWLRDAYRSANRFLPDRSGQLGKLWELLETIFKNSPGLREQLDRESKGTATK
jgi:tetratricopeptide (TPR) repeat protein